MTDPAPLLLWQMAPCWGLPSASPFCIKLEAWLRMAGVPYEVRVPSGLPRSASRKVPYIEDAQGRVLADTHVIIETLTAERGVELDDGLDAPARALATVVTRTLEDHFYWGLAWDRWMVPSHWVHTRRAYFGGLPALVRGLVPPLVHRGMRRTFHGQGFGRMTEAAIMDRLGRDLAAVADLLGAQEHPLGRPSSLDATVYAFVVSALRPPFDGPLQRAVARHGTLVAFCERFEQRWW